MTPSLDRLFPENALRHALEERLVVRREHPRFPLAILNYTERCQYERGLWNNVTLQCRGLIYNTATLEIVARPFRKFFNYGQEGAPVLALDEPVTVTDKLDGSLGILYPTPEGYAVATRGAFESEQALHATEVFRSRYDNRGFYPSSDWTTLVEIVYPTNRIVLDYEGMDELVLLGGVEIATGNSVGPDAYHFWPGPRAQTFACGTLAEALAVPPRKNAEGLVIWFPRTDERVKVKQEDYVALHRIVTGLNERTVWEHLAAGKPLAELIAPLPDEFHGWVGEVAAGLVAKVETDAAEVEQTYSMILTTLPANFTRKDFALSAKEHPFASCLFARMDGKDCRPTLWKAHYPDAFKVPKVYSEDTA